LIIENEKYKNTYHIYQKELETKAYNPEHEYIISSLNKSVQEKEIENRALKAEKI
jgi:hypothetical protein